MCIASELHAAMGPGDVKRDPSRGFPQTLPSTGASRYTDSPSIRRASESQPCRPCAWA
ncbi:protein of unknown function [Methylorubrum extorquens]|uniref:Uncharacterized protein n=1 Tax=Methylorubrum extorquens TaxID=408 RepID=A0A2N9AS59_METEX|nr:protein of unknown function [Methylorubrum extorquens]